MVFCYSATQKSKYYADVLSEILNCSVYILETDIDVSKRVSFMIRCVWAALINKAVPVLNMPSSDILDNDEIYLCGPIWAGSPALPLQWFLNNAPINGKTVHMILTASISHTKHKDTAKQIILDSGCVPGHVEVFATGAGVRLERDVIESHIRSLIL